MRTAHTAKRDIHLAKLDESYRNSVAYQYGKFAEAFCYEMMPEKVVRFAKTILLDSIGVMIGALDCKGFAHLTKAIETWGGTPEATVLGTGMKTSAGNATLANIFLVHALGYNDLGGGGGHNSDTMPAILAVAERENVSGKDFLTAMVLSYELGGRFTDAVGGIFGYAPKGFPFDIRGGISIPPCVGKLLGLDAWQIANAIGICASHSIPLGILDTNNEENVHAKNLRMGFVGRDAIEACLLAKNGFTGPMRVVEGDHGYSTTLLTGIDLEKAVNWSGWRIFGARFKNVCSDSTTMGMVQTAIQLVNEHDSKPEDVDHVLIQSGRRAYGHTSAQCKKYPRNVETCDHSSFYATAVAIKDRKCTINAMDPKNWDDPVILDLIDKIEAKPTDLIDESGSGGIVDIWTKDGSHYHGMCEEAYGMGVTELTYEEVEAKFREMVELRFSKEHTDKLIDTIMNVEKLDSIRQLIDMTILNSNQ